MIQNDIAISLANISKDFRLPHEKVDSVKSLFVNPLRSRKGLKTETQHALKDVSFEIKKGEFFGIVGRNGSGKSTLLKIIAGIYQPTEGVVKTNGRLVPFIELGVGFNPELTGRENVYLNGALMGFSVKEVDGKYAAIVEFSELERFMDQKLKNYSSGMQVRLAFSVATILADSDILLIDEVLAVGDADFQRKCFNYFSKLKKLKKTVVFVSHDMSAVREYCNRAAFIDESQLMSIGKTDEIAELYDRLFMREHEEVKSEERGPRWGEGQAITESVKVITNANEIIITQTITAKTDISDPIVGFRLRTASGDAVLGTNTRIEKIKIGKLARGKSMEIDWTFDNVLSDGEYLIDPAVILQDGKTTADWWDEAAKISVTKARHLPYNVDLKFEVAVQDVRT